MGLDRGCPKFLPHSTEQEEAEQRDENPAAIDRPNALSPAALPAQPISAAAATTIANDTAKKKIPTKASPASAIRIGLLSALLPILTTASRTMAMTAAFSPK